MFKYFLCLTGEKTTPVSQVKVEHDESNRQWTGTLAAEKNLVPLAFFPSARMRAL
jgi:hypothetical protein